MVIRVLIINRQLVFAVTIKQALEQTGAFEVHPFTDPNAAMEYLRTHPHEVALVDFAIKVMPGAEIVRHLREIQPEIAVIVSPMQNDSNRLIRDLSLQGMVDAPFSARAIIPLIEHAVEQMSQPSQAITRSFVEPEQPAASDTEILSRSEPEKVRPRSRHDEPADTRILPDEQERSVTRDLTDLEDENLPQTRILRHESARSEPAQTRILPESEEDEPEVIDMSRRTPAKTKILDDDDEFSPPPSLPEFSSLDDVLADEAPSALFEPPVKDGDTPAVPDVDSDAIRQFLATSSQSSERTFDWMLGDVQADEEPGALPQLPGGDFNDLVNSMRAESQYTPLPDRHQQFVEFILTGGMESLITEIEKRKTDTLQDPDAPGEAAAPPEPPEKAPPPAASFETLLADEPPMPTLEEGGTVSDLMVGVSDTSFRNVLAMMRGEERTEEDAVQEQRPTPSRQEIEEAYAAFFEHEVASHEEDSPLQPPSLPEEPPEEQSITAQLILETALDESTPVDSFSLDYLIDNIERQLVEHKPEIQPLPSWNIKSFQKQPRLNPKTGKTARDQGETKRYIQEPDFLPEEFPESTAHPVTEDDPPQEVLWEMLRQAEDARAALDEALQIDSAADDADSEPTGFDGPTLKPAVEPDWLMGDTVSDETVLGSGRDTAMTVPPSLPEEVFFDEDEISSSSPVWHQAEDDWDIETDWARELEPVTPAPPPSLPDDWALTIDEGVDDATVMMERPQAADVPVTLGAAADFEPQYAEFDMAEPDDPYIAQIALSLTQVSLELAAEATLLTNETEIVAFAGHLADDEVEELRKAIADDWDANPNEARVRFITLAASGKDYMLYSRKTVNNFTLTMIFSGSTPLRDIRRQGRRLMEALESVPEVAPEAPPQTMPEVATMTGEVSAVEPEPVLALQPFTYLWLLRNPDLSFDTRTARALAAGLNMQLGELGWQVRTLRAQGEYVYIHADVPGDRPAYAVIEDLKRRAAEITHAQDPGLPVDTLWADSYLVMMPGRELDPDEIDQFISFERMA